jgi:hypothetical protein
MPWAILLALTSTVGLPEEGAMQQPPHGAPPSTVAASPSHTEQTRVSGDVFRGPPSQQIGASKSPAGTPAGVFGHVSALIDQHFAIIGTLRDLPQAMAREEAEIPSGEKRT